MVVLTGVVINSLGFPVENATVVIPKLKAWAETNDDGYFSFVNIPQGIYTISVVQRNYRKFTSEVHLKQDMSIEITMV